MIDYNYQMFKIELLFFIIVRNSELKIYILHLDIPTNLSGPAAPTFSLTKVDESYLEKPTTAQLTRKAGCPKNTTSVLYHRVRKKYFSSLRKKNYRRP